MKNKLMKTVTVMLVALAMVISVLSVGAADTNGQGETSVGEPVTLGTDPINGEITVTGLAKGDVAYLYKVIDIEYNAKTNNVTKEWNDGVKDFVAEYGSVEETFENQEGGFTELAKKLYADLVKDIFASEGTPNWMAVKTAGDSAEAARDMIGIEANESVVFDENIGLGQYMVIVTGKNVYAPMTATIEPEVNEENQYIVYPNVNIVAKASNPKLDKSIVNGTHGTENDSVAIGDTVEFSLTTQVPAFPVEAVDKTFRLIDTMEDGIVGANDIEIVIESTKDRLVSNEDYRVTYYKADGSTTDDPKKASKFKIDLLISKCPKVNGQTITVTYNSEVTAEIVPGEAEVNKVALIWPKNVWEAIDKKNPDNKEPEDTDEYNELEDQVKVYTYGLKILKTDTDDKPLKGAAFKILKGSEKGPEVDFVMKEKGSYRVAEPGEESVHTDLQCDDGARLTLAGLDEGTYYIVETVVPTGYVQAKPKRITITDTQAETHELTGKAKESNEKNAYADATFVNKKGFNLPKTGGAGTAIFTLIGVVLMGGALLLVVRMRKANGAK